MALIHAVAKLKVLQSIAQHNNSQALIDPRLHQYSCFIVLNHARHVYAVFFASQKRNKLLTEFLFFFLGLLETEFGPVYMP